MLIFRAFDALIQDCHIEILVTTPWDLLNIYFNASASGFFSCVILILCFQLSHLVVFFYHWRWICYFTVAIAIKYHTISFLYSIFSEINSILYLKKKDIFEDKNLPMPTCPAFSSDGVPGPLAGRESAPSVALYIRLVIYFILLQAKQSTPNEMKRERKR